MSKHATFKRMDQSTQEDWALIGEEFKDFSKGLVDRVIAHLRLLEGDYGGFPIDRFSHCLQTATLAYRDGRDEEYVVCALLHDIGDTLGSFNHPEVAAAILKPFVSAENHWMIENHGVFQGHNFFHFIGMDRDMRDMFRDHPQYERTREFVDLYDNPAFDPDGEILPLEFFEPMLRNVFAKPKNSFYQRAIERLMQPA
ncbi:HD domain-containing protein [Pseudomonas sp. GLN_6]|uniref:HD domain-containing protein n=1 Tax=Pseudomonas sp. GLN_6 TaxID=3367183 RepID=UPI00370A83DC